MSVYSATGFLRPDQADAYIKALLDLLGTEDPIAVLEATPAALRRALDAFSPSSLQTPEAPGKWSAAMVMAHLADSELVVSFRLRMILAHDRPVITPYDQDRWAGALHYDRISPEANLQRFTVLREANVVLFANATAEELGRVGLHGERGEESVDRMRRLHAGHDLLHLRQLARIRATISA